MINKVLEKEKAIELRREGFSYNEILRVVPVAKSSLSLWLRSVRLSRRQKQRLTVKKLAAMRRGWKKVRQSRIDRVNEIKKIAENEISHISKRELWLIGTALYWAEGSKQRIRSVSQPVTFNNSDPLMIKLFIKWLKECCSLNNVDIKYELYIHKNSFNELGAVKKYWEVLIGAPISSVYFKRNKISKNRQNIREGYYGLIRVCVRRSSILNRKISGWANGICKNCGVV